MHRLRAPEEHQKPYFSLQFLPAFVPTPERIGALSECVHALTPADLNKVRDVMEKSMDPTLAQSIVFASLKSLTTIPTHRHADLIWDEGYQYGITMPLWVTGGISFFQEPATNLVIPFKVLACCQPLIALMIEFSRADLLGPFV